jgi:4a-hydroxytetrahydrobiopterin dehydratase
MENLQQMKCVPCRGDVPVLNQAEIEALALQVPEWKVVEKEGVKHLARTYKFPDFKQALAFTVKVGQLAEAEDHHPVIVTEWGKVTVTFWTHSIHGLHRNDFIMAAKTDAL